VIRTGKTSREQPAGGLGYQTGSKASSPLQSEHEHPGQELESGAGLRRGRGTRSGSSGSRGKPATAENIRAFCVKSSFYWIFMTYEILFLYTDFCEIRKYIYYILYTSYGPGSREINAVAIQTASNSPSAQSLPQELLRRRPSKNREIFRLGRNGCGVVAPAPPNGFLGSSKTGVTGDKCGCHTNCFQPPISAVSAAGAAAPQA
jgi:hypothetical protein